MWEYDFIRHAICAGIIVATISAIISVLVVLKKSIFATHALGHMSITGAAASGIIGIPAIFGQLVLNILAAIVIAIWGERLKKSDLIIGVILTFVLGIGSYLLFLYQNSYSGSVMSVLFGNILAVDNQGLLMLLILAIIIIVILIFIARPLLFFTVDPVVATAQNTPIAITNIAFFIVIALSVSMACQVVGALLLFALLIMPGAIAIRWCDGFYKLLGTSIVIANFAIIAAIIIAYYLNLPVSFCVTTILAIAYFISIIK